MAVLTQIDAQAAVVAKVLTVSGIGQVHAYRRFVRNEAAVQTFYLSDGVINGWTVTPGSPPVTNVTGGIGLGLMATLRFTVEGHYGINDVEASEPTFRDLCYRVFLALNAFVLITPQASHRECTWDQFGYVALADMYLLHYAKFTVGLWGRILA